MRPADYQELLEHMGDAHPGAVRAFIEAHPLHLMAATGQEVKRFHAEAVDAMLHHRRMLWLAPRGFGKSNVAIFMAAWLAIAHPDRWHRSIDPRAFFEGAPERVTPANIRIALVGSTQDHAMATLFSIKSILVRPVIANTFGSMVGEKRWREKSADTALRDSNRKEPTFSTMGVDSGIAGGHFEYFLADDIATDANMRTERSREHTRNTWCSTILPTVRPFGRILMLGTRWARDDLAQTIIEQTARRDWEHVMTTRAIVEDDEGKRYSIWPELWPLDRLLAKRKEMGSRPFEAQFQMNASALGGGMYTEEMLQNFQDFEDLPEADRRRAKTTIGIDPALSLGERADFTAIVVVSRVGDRFFVRHCARGKWSFSRIIAETRKLVKEYGSPDIHWCLIESTQGQRELVRQFKEKAPEVPARAQDPLRLSAKGKEARAMANLKYFEQHEDEPPRMFFAHPTQANGIGRLLEELSAFPSEKGHGVDDCVDALQYALFAFQVSRTRLRKARVW